MQDICGGGLSDSICYYYYDVISNVRFSHISWKCSIFLKNILFAPKGQTGHKDTKNMNHIKEQNLPESIGASFLKISWLEPEIFQVKEWFQVKVSIPVASGPYL